MELKYIMVMKILTLFWCSNRTFMELKYADAIHLYRIHRVLIVPLWN